MGTSCSREETSVDGLSIPTAGPRVEFQEKHLNRAENAEQENLQDGTHEEKQQTENNYNKQDIETNTRGEAGDKKLSNDTGQGQVVVNGSSKVQNETVNTVGSNEGVVTILHFNDVYNIEPRDQEPVGGAARFKTTIDSFKHLNPMVLFSGDVFAPSLMSTVTKGKQMVPVLNACNIQCSVFGNHDFDFGVEHLIQLSIQNNFPWLMSNVLDNDTLEPLAEGKITHMVEWQGKKFGLIGLVEEEWIATLSTIDPDDITFFDYVEEGRNLAKQLKQEGADFIIALTHMRWPNDERLAREVDEIDMVLGGHDHDYNIKKVNGKWVIKSGTDFRNLSQVTLQFNGSVVEDITVKQVDVTGDVKEDPEVKNVVDEYMVDLKEKMESVVGHLDVELDGRFSCIRTKETNLGNFITDIMLQATDADLAILNSGTLRSDTLHPKGPFRVKHLISILPMIDPVVVLKVSGEQVWKGLENGVSQWPKLEGRFPQVAGLKFAFDPQKPAGSRIDPKHITVGDSTLNLEKTDYRMATKSYIADGKDGYDMFKGCEVLVDDENAPVLSTVVQNHFEAVGMLQGTVQPSHSSHRQSIISLSRRKSISKQVTLPNPDTSPSAHSRAVTPERQQSIIERRASVATMGTPARLERRKSIHEVEMDTVRKSLAPGEEGRIVIFTDEAIREKFILNRLLESDTIMVTHSVVNTVIGEDSEHESGDDN